MNGFEIVLLYEEFGDVFVQDFIVIRLSLVGYHLPKLTLVGS